jgi:gamma-glutamyltranspeptidase / glutathione hydrolase
MSEPFSWELPYPWPHKPVLAHNLVCTSQPLAAQAGLTMLAAGGNAVDAALATAITLTRVEPVSNGIGSDAFALVWDGATLHGLNASGRSPAAWTPEYFRGGPVPHRGWNAVTVPGAVSAWAELHSRFGRLPFEQLFGPAIRYGREGFLVSPTVARQWSDLTPGVHDQPGFAEAFLPDGQLPKPGQLFPFPEHAATLERIAATGGADFYTGDLAERIQAHSSSHGGAMTKADLAAHRADWVEPITRDYRGYTVHEIPPNGQGVVALIALGILSHFDIAALQPNSVEATHLQIEALKLAFADAHAYVSDPAYMDIRPAELVDPDYLRHRASLIDPARATPMTAGTPRGGTVYLTAADSTGMMVSMIQSNYEGFGSGVVVPGTGISLHNRGSNFVATPGHPNRVGPNKRPYHTIIPAFVTKDGAPVMSFGVMGGPMQPQGHVQVLVRIADFGQNPQTACDAPRFRVVGGLEVNIESGFPAATAEGLRQLGHQINEPDGHDEFGSCQAIWQLPNGYLGVTDPRRDGHVAAF